MRHKNETVEAADGKLQWTFHLVPHRLRLLGHLSLHSTHLHLFVRFPLTCGHPHPNSCSTNKVIIFISSSFTFSSRPRPPPSFSFILFFAYQCLKHTKHIKWFMMNDYRPHSTFTLLLRVR
uniref:Uncharacterized protein n=1 Tax=Trypanosoma vivax (strain Y486) TaxID=1055687 RepID=G0U5D6_TRYVY|nr:hypothetical protein, unlikely [Trypanosoma vivax Y486]